MVKRRLGIMAFFLCLFLFVFSFTVNAVSTFDAKEHISLQKECTLTLSYSCDGKVFSNLPVKLYKTADVSADYQFTLTPSFKHTGLILNGIQTAEEWNTVRSTLESYIIANGIKEDVVTATDEEGKVCFERLKPALYLAITESVKNDDGYTYAFNSSLVLVPGLGNDGLWQYNAEVNPKPVVTPPAKKEIEYKILKLWKGDSGYSVRPSSIEVEIFRNGVSQSKVTLSADNNWSYSWNSKDDGAKWTVIERNVPQGYMMTVEEREHSFVLINTFLPEKPEPPSKPPQTGNTSSLMFYVILMNISGFALIFLGVFWKSKRV